MYKRQLRDALISGANAIAKHKTQVDELNIFPVPDGDTGTNMSMTMGAAAKALEDASGTAGEIAKKAASALLRGARGNSGVILSLLFRGFSNGVEGDVYKRQAKCVPGSLSDGNPALDHRKHRPLR